MTAEQMGALNGRPDDGPPVGVAGLPPTVGGIVRPPESCLGTSRAHMLGVLIVGACARVP